MVSARYRHNRKTDLAALFPPDSRGSLAAVRLIFAGKTAAAL